eukprot:18888-Heterococcus_DN1.PRE.6
MPSIRHKNKVYTSYDAVRMATTIHCWLLLVCHECQHCCKCTASAISIEEFPPAVSGFLFQRIQACAYIA